MATRGAGLQTLEWRSRSGRARRGFRARRASFVPLALTLLVSAAFAVENLAYDLSCVPPWENSLCVVVFLGLENRP